MALTYVFPTHPDDVGALSNDALRERFVVSGLFIGPEPVWAYAYDDRLLIGGVRVGAGDRAHLTAPPELASSFLLERRELGVVCLEGSVTVKADGESFALGLHDVLYLPMGTRDVSMHGLGVTYLVSAPAHRRDPVAFATRDQVEVLALGAAETSNARTIRKYIHGDGIRSNQLVLGITTLEPGSVWNTFPPHIHARRTEIYLYDGLRDGSVIHLMGRPDQTRHLILRDRDAVVSPPWSIHSGAGTGSYSFVWAMAGENVDYTDVESIAEGALR